MSLDKGIPTDTVAPAEDDVPLAETTQIIDTLPTEREVAVEVVPREGEVPAAAATVLLHPQRKKLLFGCSYGRRDCCCCYHAYKGRNSY